MCVREREREVSSDFIHTSKYKTDENANTFCNVNNNNNYNLHAIFIVCAPIPTYFSVTQVVHNSITKI